MFRNHFKTLLFSLFFAIFLSGCTNGALFITQLVPDTADRFVRTFITYIADGDIDAAFNLMNPEVRDGSTKVALEEAAQTLKSNGHIVKIELIKFINSKAYLTKKNKKTFLRYQVQLDRGYVHVTALVHNTGPDFILSGFYIEELPSHLSKVNTFELSGKPLYYYVMLLFSVAVPLFILYSLYACVRMKGLFQKWKWFIFIFFGFTSFTLNWTNGLWGFQLLTVNVVGATVLRDGIYGPWMVTWYVPVGAILFQRKLRNVRRDYRAYMEQKKGSHLR